MLGFSMDQLLVVAAVCMLILGPQQTLKAAYWLGGRIGRLRRLLDECKRELDVNHISNLKEELTPALKSLREQTLSMSKDLKNAMRETSEELTPTVPTLTPSDSVRRHSAGPGDNTGSPASAELERSELWHRLEVLELEIADLRRCLNSQHDGSACNAVAAKLHDEDLPA